MQTTTLLNLLFILFLAVAIGVLALISYLPGANNGRLLREAGAVFTIPELLPYGRFTFMEFNQTLNGTAEPDQGDTKLYLVYNGVLASKANINWGNRLRVQIVNHGDCNTAALMLVDTHPPSTNGTFPNCTDDAFLYNRTASNPIVCPQSELTCMHLWCGCVWETVDDACAW